MKRHFDKVKSGSSLSFVEAKNAAELILGDTLTPAEISEFLVALKTKKETSEEIEGFLAAIRATTKKFPALEESTPATRNALASHLVLSHPVLIDVCGTGGDGTNTFNVSTGVALVLASLGIKVAKHGNRSVSSLSGSSDVLHALGIEGDTHIEGAIQSLTRKNVSFLHAPAFYSVLAKLAPIRKSIGSYTIFNALGPLLNPAPITHQLMGVYDQTLLMNAALSIKARGVKDAFVVHGSDGLDELTLSGETHALRLHQNEIESMTFTPEDFGLKRAKLSEVRGGNPAENAEILLSIYGGEKSPKRDLLVLNAAAAFALVEGHVNFKTSAAKIETALDSGVTLKFVKGLRRTS